eukprot:3091720-Amphidinium_carterae.2
MSQCVALALTGFIHSALKCQAVLAPGGSIHFAFAVSDLALAGFAHSAMKYQAKLAPTGSIHFPLKCQPTLALAGSIHAVLKCGCTSTCSGTTTGSIQLYRIVKCKWHQLEPYILLWTMRLQAGAAATLVRPCEHGRAGPPQTATCQEL